MKKNANPNEYMNLEMVIRVTPLQSEKYGFPGLVPP